MAKKSGSDLQSLQSSLYDHERDGIEVLLSPPSRLMFAINLTILAVIAAAIAWACFAKADVIVTAKGSLQPKEKIRRVFPPIDGELRGIYVENGASVQAGDIIARVNARGAVQAASKAQEARLKLAQVRAEMELFPQKRAILQQESDALQAQLIDREAELSKRRAEGLTQVSEAQRARLAESRAQLNTTRRAEETARLESEKFERLAASPGGGGVSRNQVRQKRDAFLDAQGKRAAAEAQQASLEFEVNQAISKADKAFSTLQQELAQLRVRQATAAQKVTEEEAKLDFRLRGAELAAGAAERLSFDNFDEDNFLQIYAPVSGVVTEVASTQIGEKVQANRAVISIAPTGSQRVVNVRIAEKDRGFLRAGQVAKLKFNAFPFRSYGSLSGTLEYISPTATTGEDKQPPSYSGRISLNSDTISTPQGDIELTYGMGAIAELVVRERRFIDLALDPVRGLAN